MRILHTSDWHLGASLEDASRDEDHRLFLQWLLGVIRSEAIDVLVVAGDVFDQPNPSADAQSLYYRFLHDLSLTDLRKIVVVGGNHDSAARLDAPRELLETFRIHVVGGLDESHGRERSRFLCPVEGSSGEVEVVVACVPFLHEWRLGFRMQEGGDNAAGLGEPFRRFYAELADEAQQRWPDATLVATGHLAIAGSSKDDAPQEIHLIGSLGGLPTGIFDPRFCYVALGHIHRAYAIQNTKAWYSGSPIALNAKEGLQPRTVNLVDLVANTASVSRLEVAGTRQVRAFQGEVESVKASLSSLRWEGPLRPMVMVDLRVAGYQVGLEEEMRRWVLALDGPILVGLTQSQMGTIAPGVQTETQRLAELEPREVFRLLCEARGEHHADLEAAFESLLAHEVRP